MFDDEFDVFFDVDEFAVLATWQRAGETDVTFAAILSSVEDDLFDGQVTAGVHVLRFPTAAVAEMLKDDTVRTVRKAEDGTLLPEEVWRVIRSPARVNDGAESDVYLTPDPDA